MRRRDHEIVGGKAGHVSYPFDLLRWLLRPQDEARHHHQHRVVAPTDHVRRPDCVEQALNALRAAPSSFARAISLASRCQAVDTKVRSPSMSSGPNLNSGIAG